MMLQALTEVLQRRRTEGWLVGGSVRDLELGRSSPDLDLVVADDAATVAREAARLLKVPCFALSERHSAYRVMGCDGHIDVAALRGKSIVDDLAERDFTVNAMAIPLSGGDTVDPFGGLAHLREGRLVAVSDHVFVDDPLRLIRAARFAHILDLRPDACLIKLIQAQAPLLAHAAVERVVSEIVLTLADGRAAEAVRSWRDLGLLEVVLPEIIPERLEAALSLLDGLDDILEQPSAWFPQAGNALIDRLSRSVDGLVARPVALRLAGLMHRVTAKETYNAGRRLKLSRDLVSLLRTTSEHLCVDEALPATPARRSAVLFLWSTAPWEPEVIVLAGAKVAAEAGGDNHLRLENALDQARRLMALWGDRALYGTQQLPVDGESLMNELGLAPGPVLGRVLREIRLAWEAGEATTREQLIAIARVVLAEDCRVAFE